MPLFFCTISRLIQASGVIPIARVRLRLKVSMPAPMAKKIKDQLLALTVSVESESWDADFELVSARIQI